MKLTTKQLKQIIKEEAQKLEGMAAWKARVLGIGIEDVL